MTAITTDDQDAADMARLVEGEDLRLNDLIERHGQRLFNYLVRSLEDRTDAEEVAQETFARVYLNRTRYDSRRRFSTWLYAIATNLVRDRLRWRTRHPTVSLHAEQSADGNLADVLPDPSALPSEGIDVRERSRMVGDAVHQLPEELRTPLLLSTYEGRSHAEIGAIVGCTAKAVEMRIYRARNELRRVLAGRLDGG
jgi:RNA polymerase sigma-70 factor (ECF subfamily)